MEHTVKVTVEIPSISKVDTSYEIKADGKKLGTLKISKGGIKYIPSKHTKGINKTWIQLHDLLTKVVLVPVFILLFMSCTEKKHYSYTETLPEDIKLSKRKLIELEALPGLEEEKIAMKNNIAVAELAHLKNLLSVFNTDYINSHNEIPSEEVVLEFKKEIKYDSLEAEFRWVIEEAHAE